MIYSIGKHIDNYVHKHINDESDVSDFYRGMRMMAGMWVLLFFAYLFGLGEGGRYWFIIKYGTYFYPFLHTVSYWIKYFR